MFIRFLFILTNWYIQFEEGIDKHVTMDKESILGDCYLFLVQKSAIFAYVWAIFPVIALVFLHWIFIFPKLFNYGACIYYYV